MGTIRKQSITSSLLAYIGFFVGAINTWLFTKAGHFTTEEFALTRLFFEIGQNIYLLSTLGAIPLIIKFYPYYNNKLPSHKIDLFARACWFVLIGIVGVCVLGYLLEPIVVKKFIARSKLIVDYYYLMFPFAWGMVFFALLEAQSWAIQQTVMPNFMKETGLRVFILLFIALFYWGLVNFQQFLYVFTSLYWLGGLVLVFYLVRKRALYIPLARSYVTKRLGKKMLHMQALVLGGIVVQGIAQTVDSIMIASVKGLQFAGVYTLAQYAANFIQVPQRSLQSIAAGILAQSFKQKDYQNIQSIYRKSSINMLLMSLLLYGNMLLNAATLMQLLHINTDFYYATTVLIVLGISRIVDAGTGVNGVVIATSNFWSFDFLSGMATLVVRLPLTYLLIQKMGIIGAAWGELIGMLLYNSIRFVFIKKKLGYQPFNLQTIKALVLFVCCFALVQYMPLPTNSWLMLFCKAFIFSGLFVLGIFLGNISEDAWQLWQTIKQRWKR